MPHIVLPGDCRQSFSRIPDNSCGLGLTDPPYEISIAGKGWDSSGIAFDPQVWRGYYRVLRPGAHLLVFGACYDAQTEILTGRGWVRFPEIASSDTFASLNPETHKVEFQQASALIRQPHYGPMHKYETNRIDLLVTPNHKMMVAAVGSKKPIWRLEESQTVDRSVRMLKKSEGLAVSQSAEGFFTLPGAVRGKNDRGGGRPNLPAVDIPLRTWAAFLGFWLAQGSATRWKEESGHVALCHFVDKDVREMVNMLSPYFNVLHYPDAGKLRINDPRLYNHLESLGKALTKRAPEYVFGWSPELLRILIEWWARGDGTRSEATRLSGRVYTSSYELASDFQILAMYAGTAADISVRKPSSKVRCIEGREIKQNGDNYMLRLLPSQHTPHLYNRADLNLSYKTEISAEDWNGQTVYCVELPRHHTLYVRRNGKAVWCGNSRTIHRVTCAIEDVGFEIRDQISWCYASGMSKGRDISKAIDELVGAKRPVLYSKSHTAGGGESYGFQKGPKRKISIDVTAPGSAQAARWDGWNTSFVPAHEPIVVARKPLQQATVERNVLQWGTGAMNVREGSYGTPNGVLLPKNVVISHAPQCTRFQCVEGCPGKAMGANVDAFMQLPYEEPFCDPLVFCDKPKREEKDAGCWHLPRRAPDPASTMAASPQARERNAAIERGEVQGMLNFHPTAKPVNLMNYLIGIFGVPGLPIIDSFTGSGTTGVAAIGRGHEFVGMELTPDYLPIIEGRLNYAEQQYAARLQRRA